ncbi:DUF3467 domain-containing protein [Paenibacillus sp. FSL E2-8871]|uniref:DUF3467 domain-containing protein n=1 Tax=Paenibacillus sp. FSL E2-8871 TaxID=2975326 RepID=UPI0030F6A3A0
MNENSQSQSQLPIYTNSVSVRISMYDFTLDVGYTDDGTTQDMLTRIAMSPQHFKAMVKMLGANLQAYERVYGEISTAENTDVLKMMEQAYEAEKGTLING